MFPNKEFERTKSDIPMTGDQRSVEFVNSLAMIYDETILQIRLGKNTREDKVKACSAEFVQW